MNKQNASKCSSFLTKRCIAEWKSNRKVLSQLFRHDKVCARTATIRPFMHECSLLSFPPSIQLKSYVAAMVQSSHDLIERCHRETGKRIDMMSLFRCVTFDVIGLAAFGLNFGAVLGNRPQVCERKIRRHFITHRCSLFVGVWLV